jgi:hypothetical protein
VSNIIIPGGGPKVSSPIIKAVSQLELDSLYRIDGSAADGLPIPPQVFWVQSISPGFMGQTYIHGRVYWKDTLGTHRSPSMMMAAEVNVPPNDWSDMYLRKVDWVQEGVASEVQFYEIDQHRKRYKPARHRRIEELLDHLGVGE